MLSLIVPHASAEVDATYTPPAHDYSLLVVKVWANIHGGGWSLVTSVGLGDAVFDWDEMGAFSLESTEWTVHYQCASAGLSGDFWRFGDDDAVDWDSRIVGVTEALGVLPLVVGGGVLGVSVIG